MSASGIGGHHGLDVWSYVARLGVHMRGAGDDFFAEGDSVCAMRTCQYMTQVDIEEFLHKDYEEFACSVPTCQARFSQLIDSETHYNAKHRHACSQCKKCLPSAHLLDLHLSETHDSYFQLLSAKKPSFQCFLETCPCRFWSPKDRREHCIQIHSFPKNFKFDESTSKKSSSRNSKASSSSPQEVRKRQPREQSKKQKARPASVFVAPMETDQIDGNLKTLMSTPPTKSRLPRRLSLNSSSNNKSPDKESPMKDTTTPEVSLSSREPFSLAKMGQRLTAKSTFDIQTNLNHDESPKSNGSVRRHSGIPTFRGFKKTNSTSSTATTMSSPDRSLTASPTKSRSTVSMNNNSGSSLEASSSSRVVTDDLNGNNSPTKSRIPIRSPSCKKAHVPRNVCFGKSSQKAFIKPWYHNFGKSSSETNSMDAFASVDEMKMALDE